MDVSTALAKPRVARAKPDPDSQEIHHKLRRLVDARAGARLDRDVAAAANLSPESFSRILNGRVDPTMSNVLAILKALGATLCDLDKA